MKRPSIRRLFSSFILLAIGFGNFGLLAQTRRGPKPAATAAAGKKSGCAGGWSGIVNFKKTLKDSLESDKPGIRKDIDRISHRTSRDYQYTGRAIVDGSKPPNATVNTSVAFTDKDLNWGREKVFDTCNSREAGHWFVIEGIDDRVTQAEVKGSARSFNLSVNEAEGNYSFSLAFPVAEGQYKREQHVKKSGHCQPKNNEPYDDVVNQPVRIDGESFSVYNEKIDAEKPDTISGTKIWGGGEGAVKGFIYEVSWHFTRCPERLLITELKFEHPKFPDYENWTRVVGQLGTIDGNRVKITAKALNLSSETKYATLSLSETFKGDKWNGSRPDERLPESESTFRLEGGEEREIEYIWDTEGQSWFNDGRSHELHRIKAELKEDNIKKDEKTEHLKIAPKPVVLVHGLWSSAKVWIPLYQNLLTTRHGYLWKAYPVGEKPENGKLNTGGEFLSAEKTNSIYENADELAKYVRYAQEASNAWHVDIVAHSMGGLISRLYIHRQMPDMPDNRPLVKHLVMLGTPNAGSPCADTIDLKFRLFNDRVQAIKDLKPENVAIFNQYVRDRKRVKFSALAGNPIPLMCGGYEWNDGVVTVNSARYGIEDFAYSNDIHTTLTDSRNFGNFVAPHLITGPDGKYPVAVRSDPNDIDRWKINSRFTNAGEYEFLNARFGGGAASASEVQQFRAEMELNPNQTIDIELPVEAAPNLGVTFLANNPVAVSLIDEKGLIVSENSSETAPADAFFRMLFVRKPVQRGVWKLRAVNSSAAKQVLLAFSWSAFSGVSSTGPVAE